MENRSGTDAHQHPLATHQTYVALPVSGLAADLGVRVFDEVLRGKWRVFGVLACGSGKVFFHMQRGDSARFRQGCSGMVVRGVLVRREATVAANRGRDLSRVKARLASRVRRVLPSRAAALGAAALALAACVGVGTWVFFGLGSSPTFEVISQGSQLGDEDGASDGSSGSQNDASGAIVVYVSGAVVNPGVYEVAEGGRVNDAVVAAGGLAEDAASDAVNLARVVSDGEQVDIPTQQEAEAAASSAGVSEASFSGGTNLVNINTADEAALDTLPGVGPSTAQAIIADREANGPFASIEDLQRVDGIGEKKFAKLKASICV